MGSSRPAAALALAIIAGVTGCGSSGGSSTATPSATPAATLSIPNLQPVTPGSLTVAMDIPYPPQEFYDASHNPAGFDVDIGQAIAGRLGLKAVFVNQAFDGILTALNNKKFDIAISAMTITDDRRKQATLVPYLKAGKAIVVQANQPFQPKTLKDLCGHRVGVQSSTVEADQLHTLAPTCATGAAITISEFTTDSEGIDQLTQGKLEAEFTDSPPGGYAAQQSGGKLQVSSGILDVAPEGIAIANGDAAMADAVTQAFAAMRADGTYQQLLTKWGLSDGAIG